MDPVTVALLKLLEASPVLALCGIVWMTQRDILRSQQSTNRKLARIEQLQLGQEPVLSPTTPALGVPIRRQPRAQTRNTRETDDAPSVPRTTTEDIDG